MSWSVVPLVVLAGKITPEQEAVVEAAFAVPHPAATSVSMMRAQKRSTSPIGMEWVSRTASKEFPTWLQPKFPNSRWSPKLISWRPALPALKLVVFRISYRIRASPPMVNWSMSVLANAGSAATITPPTANTARVINPESVFLMCIATLLLIVPCASLSFRNVFDLSPVAVSGLLDSLLGVVGLLFDRFLGFLHVRFEILLDGFHLRLHQVQLGLDRLLDILL